MKTSLRLLLLLGLTAGLLSADTDAIVNKARAYLGEEAALDAVKSVRYAGTLTTNVTNAAGESQSSTSSIEIVFLAPYYQRIDIVSESRIDTTALDDYEAWNRIENPADASQWRMTLLDVGQVRRLRANTWENLAYFRGIEKAGGKLHDLGMVDLNGQQVHKLGYDHGHGIVFFRYIDPTTGKLLLSETDNGAQIVENGENFVSGVRFPEEIVTSSSRPDGSTQMVKVVFDSILVNPEIDRSLFRVPSITTE